MVAQALGGLAHGIAYSLGSILAAHLGGIAWGGAAVTATTLGAAGFAQPMARIAGTRGRRAALTLAMGVGFLGTVTCFTAAQLASLALLVVGFGLRCTDG